MSNKTNQKAIYTHKHSDTHTQKHTPAATTNCVEKNFINVIITEQNKNIFFFFRLFMLDNVKHHNIDVIVVFFFIIKFVQ